MILGKLLDSLCFCFHICKVERVKDKWNFNRQRIWSENFWQWVQPAQRSRGKAVQSILGRKGEQSWGWEQTLRNDAIVQYSFPFTACDCLDGLNNKKKKLLCIIASLEILLLHNAWHAMGSKARIVLALCPKWRFLSKAHIKRKHILSLIYCVTVLSLFSPTLNPALKPFILHNWVVGDIEKSEWLYWPCDL